MNVFYSEIHVTSISQIGACQLLFITQPFRFILLHKENKLLSSYEIYWLPSGDRFVVKIWVERKIDASSRVQTSLLCFKTNKPNAFGEPYNNPKSIVSFYYCLANVLV